jgi:uncharacterized protein (TIGR04255 family)
MPYTNNIVQVIFDIWFESDVPGEVLLGEVIKKFDLKNVQELPLLSSIPDLIRKNDPNFKYQPIYEISNEKKDIKILIGTFSIGFATTKYKSWEESVKPYIKKALDLLKETDYIKQKKRMGLKYINFFENENIFEIGNIEININKFLKQSEEIVLKINDKENLPKSSVTILNYQNLKINNEEKSGSIVDIIAYNDDLKPDQLLEIAESLHTKVKQIYEEIKP